MYIIKIITIKDIGALNRTSSKTIPNNLILNASSQKSTRLCKIKSNNP